ncbi:MAG: hypothetical protein HY238_14390 [Acidobacteria bacterium]|nr:hypothetical protein [Acidobacteriota bacterium]
MSRNFNLGRLLGEPGPLRNIKLALIGLFVFDALFYLFAIGPLSESDRERRIQVANLARQEKERTAQVEKLASVAKKVEFARTHGDQLLEHITLPRRTAFSALVSELDAAGKKAGVELRDRGLNVEPIEGSDTLSMLTVTQGLDVKIGAERNKLLVLIGLLAVAVVLLYQQFFSGPAGPAAASTPRSPAPAARQIRAAADEILADRAAPKTRNTRTNSDFKPSLKMGKPGEGPDPERVDPTLRTDLLAKVQAVTYEGAERNLFQFGARQVKPTPQQIEAAKKEAAAAAAKIASAPPAKTAEPPKPQAPPINMKYFGYVNRPGDARRRAFLMDGEDILVAVEGEVIKKRYKVVRIGLNSIVVEDLDFKAQQTLPLQESTT